jgi:hypothetical protein
MFFIFLLTSSDPKLQFFIFSANNSAYETLIFSRETKPSPCRATLDSEDRDKLLSLKKTVETGLLGADEERYFNYESNRERKEGIALKRRKSKKHSVSSDKEHTNNIEV